MTTFHAVTWIDHHSAQILQFDADHVQAQKVKSHTHHTAQHGSSVRTQHEFYAQVCSALAGIPEVLVVGPKTGIADFQHYVDKHGGALAAHVVGYETVDHPTVNQLVAMARQYFLRHDRMNGVPTPT